MKSSLDYLGYHSNNICLNFLSYLLNQRAKYAILSLWDVLELNSKSRMNVPGVIDEINWTFRIKDYKNLKNKLDVLSFFVTYSGR
jgi:4-alpha-glucanotransferase